ncbi:MAG: hypothetical protein OXH96_22100 [Spirochaetaceae bacterium]|nr:hypothetical protein [Spirochaetaceae bacterium]
MTAAIRRDPRKLLACAMTAAVLTVSASACQRGAASEATTSRYQEAPMLRERVEAGELPPVDERLPDEPLVVDVPQVGEYGGSIGGGRVVQSDEWRPTR